MKRLKKSASKLNRTKLKRYSLSTAALALAIAAAVLLNLICTNLTDRFDLTLDLTADRLYEVSEDSTELLRTLEKDVTVTILMDEDDFENDTYYSNVAVLLKKYQKYAGDRLTITYIDPYKNPDVVNEYNDLSNLTLGSVIMECGDRRRALSETDFYETQSDSYGYSYASAFRGEQALTSAILAVTGDDLPQVCILNGHGESTSPSLTSLLESNGYTTDELNLIESDIPENCSLIILSLPQSDYTEDEVNKLDAFLKNGGDLLYLDGTDCPSDMPVLYSYLKEWGITVQPEMVLDSNYNLGEAYLPLASALTDADALADVSDDARNGVLVMPYARYLTLSETDKHTVSSLVETYETSYAKKLDGDTITSYDRAEGDTDGPLSLLGLSEYTGNDKGGQVLVCTAAAMTASDLMQSTAVSNQKILSTALSYMQPEVELISIESKSLYAEIMPISGNAGYIIFVILLFIPLALVFGAITIFLRRRHL
ncbi:MAG: Gldg family protein [Butyricicoccaceae bacterium]